MALSSGKFVPVSALTTNDCLHTFDGQCARVVSLTTRDGTFPVYDLEVEEDHTFGITPLGIVVHNTGHKACKVVQDLIDASKEGWQEVKHTTSDVSEALKQNLAKATGGVLRIKGEIGEEIMANLLRKEGYTRIGKIMHTNTRGIDGLYVKVVNGELKVLVGESKMWKKILTEPDGYMKKPKGNHAWIKDNYKNMLDDIPDGGITIDGKFFTRTELKREIERKIDGKDFDFKLYHTLYKDGEFATRTGLLSK